MVLLNLHWLLCKRHEINWAINGLFFLVDDGLSIFVISEVELTKFINHFVFKILNLVIVQMTSIEQELLTLHQILVERHVVQFCLVNLLDTLVVAVELLNVQHGFVPFQVTLVEGLFHARGYEEEFIVYQETLGVTIFQDFVVIVTHFFFFDGAEKAFNVI